VSGYDHEEPSIEAAATNAEANGVSLWLERRNLREGLPELAPTTVANMTAPVLRVVAEQLSGEESPGMVSRSLPAVAPGDHPRALQTLICSGLLPPELDEIVAAFAPIGLKEADRRLQGDWAALLLRA
jgi:ribosomal protein L11 methyltransferase